MLLLSACFRDCLSVSYSVCLYVCPSVCLAVWLSARLAGRPVVAIRYREHLFPEQRNSRIFGVHLLDGPQATTWTQRREAAPQVLNTLLSQTPQYLLFMHIFTVHKYNYTAIRK